MSFNSTRKFRTYYTCPCCGYKTLADPPPGTFEICEICYWEDDEAQFKDPDFDGGANKVSLREGQRNFIKIGVSAKRLSAYVRSPTEDDEKDEEWEPLEAKDDSA